MKARVLNLALANFDEIATQAGGHRAPVSYVVDVYLIGAGDKPSFSGVMEKPDIPMNSVKMNLYQYGEGKDFNTIVMDCDGIAAVRMRKPN